MAVLVPIESSRVDGHLTAPTPAVGGDSFPNTGREIVFIYNADTTKQLKATVQAAPDGKDVTERTYSVVAGFHAIGPFDPHVYNDAGGRVQLTYPTGVTNLFLCIIKMSNV